MEITIEIKNEDISDILITALEGGSNYWYLLETEGKVFKRSSDKSLSESVIAAVLEKGEEFDVYDIEEEDLLLGQLSRENIKRGIILSLKEGINPFQCLDADQADVFFQHVVMGEVRFS